MVINIHACFEIITQLLKDNVPHDKIILGFSLWGPFSICDSISVTTNGNSKEIVFDVGMNIGDSTLYFLNRPKVEKVYAFEPFRKTYMDAMENLKSHFNSPRLSTFQLGLSDHDEEKSAMFNQDMTCGQSTIDSINQDAVQNYIDWGLLREENNQTEIIQLRKSSQIFSDIIEKHPNCKFELKMDCEGEEYAIFKDLDQTGVLSKFHFIMMEWHCRGTDFLLECSSHNGFSYFAM